VQQVTPPLGVDRAAEQSFPLAAELFNPLFVLRRELLLDLAPQALRQSGTLASGGNGDLKRAAPHDSGIVKVAARGVINDIAQDAAPLGFPEHQFVQFP